MDLVAAACLPDLAGAAVMLVLTAAFFLGLLWGCAAIVVWALKR